ncbi:MAG: undecaprenyldiphospho-muramoylpentapeptide beta-N-acetylglucosaminyltransferase [Chitinophagales bacterium]
MAKKFIISGGGTGGHIFPAIAIANALKARVADAEILFVGAEGRMEMEKVPAAGFKIIGLKIAGFQRTQIWKNWSLPFKIIGSLLTARKVVREFKPDVAIGVGGYASGPLLAAAALSGVPCLIQEQNSFAGITNRILSRIVKKICVAYEGMDAVFPKEKIICTGNPVRAQLTAATVTKEAAQQFFQLNNHQPVIFVSGGSLGARTLNESVHCNLETLSQQGVQVIWQTGKSWNQPVTDTPGIKQLPFIEQMEMAYAAADVIIARAGALTIAELQIIGKPVILVPSPNVTDDHQTHNAMALVKQHAALLIKDSDARAMLIPAALNLLKDEEQQKQLALRCRQMAITNATDRIVDEILKLSA